jgi:hypothetical protein
MNNDAYHYKYEKGGRAGDDGGEDGKWRVLQEPTKGIIPSMVSQEADVDR